MEYERSHSGSSKHGRVKRLSRTRAVRSSERDSVVMLEEEDGCLRRLMSVQNVVSVMCLIGILVSSASATVVMYQVSQVGAVDATRDSGDRATEKCFNVSHESLDEVATDLLAHTTDAVVGMVESFVMTTVNEAQKMINYIKLQDGPISTWEFAESISDILYASLTSLDNQGLALTGFTSNRSTLIYYASVLGHQFILFNNGTTTNSVQHLLLPGNVVGPFVSISRTVGNSPGYIEADLGLLQPGDTKFSAITPHRTFIGAILMHYGIDSQGLPFFLTFSMTFPKVSEHLKDVATRAGSDMRLYTCTAESWIDTMRAEKGISYSFRWTEERLLTGTSHGMPFVYNSTEDVNHPLPDIEATDDVIRHTAMGIDGSYGELHASGALTNVRVSSDQNEDRLVLVRRVFFPENGLDWWLVASVSRSSVFGAVLNESAAIQAEISDDKQRVEDDIAWNLYMTAGIVLGVALVLTVMSVLVTRVILRPIAQLVQEMVWVSSMDLDKSEAELSEMREVREMQVSFRKMKRNLRDYRAFVPTALLNSNNDVLVEEAPTGTIALVFTDIVKSTELWERSATGMNTALEMHNDIIREALTAHRGYEVKTIGDSFMIAFSAPHDAISFSLSVLAEFSSQDWPTDLGLDGGLKIRIGCHVGHTIPEENPLTGRRDYRGPTVNLASRCEGKAMPGSVCATKVILERTDAHLGGARVEEMGRHVLKGIDGPQDLFLLVPASVSFTFGSPGSPVGSPNSPQSRRSRSQLYETQSNLSGSSASSAQMAAVTLPLATAVPVKKTGLTLVKGPATVAVCLLQGRRESDLFDDCNAMVRAAVDAAMQTDGVLGNVTGQTLTVVWNASKPCKLHTTAAMRFAAHLSVRSAILRVGIATGSLLYGNVGTHKRRFHTVFGATLDAAHAAAGLCAHRSTFAVFVDLTADGMAAGSAAVAPFLRLMDIWCEGARTMSVYEMLHAKLTKQLEDAWGAISVSDVELETHNACFRAALRGDKAALEKLKLMAAMGQGDPTLQGVIKSVEGLQVDENRSFRVQVSFGSVPAGVLDCAN